MMILCYDGDDSDDAMLCYDDSDDAMLCYAMLCYDDMMMLCYAMMMVMIL